MGTLIALEAAARAPERVTRLVLLGSAYPMKVSDVLLNTAREAPLKAIDMVNALSISTPASKPSYPGPGMWVHGSNRALMRNQQALSDEWNLFEHDFRLCDAYRGGEQAMAKVTCPTTLITGARDQMTAPKTTQALASALKARVVMVPSGHLQPAETPDAVLAALREALAR
jgi:pimeloyl-ACP methyl ester carboxylesterase